MYIVLFCRGQMYHPHNVRGPESTHPPTGTSGLRTPEIVRMQVYTFT